VHVGEFSKEDQIIYRIPKGAVIADVTAGSGAQQAGLASGDLITAINEEEIASVDELKAALSGLKAGDRVKVSFVRPDEDNAYRDDNVTSVMVTLQ
jgi:serine protease Do